MAGFQVGLCYLGLEELMESGMTWLKLNTLDVDGVTAGSVGWLLLTGMLQRHAAVF
jgi:hypothetical protein